MNGDKLWTYDSVLAQDSEIASHKFSIFLATVCFNAEIIQVRHASQHQAVILQQIEAPLVEERLTLLQA